MCFDIAKLWCFWLNIFGYFFSLSYMPMNDMFKKKNMQRKTKTKRIEVLLNMVASVFLGDVGVIGYTSKVIVPIKQLWLFMSDIWSSHISNHHNMRNLFTLVMFSHTTRKFFATFDTCAGIMWFSHHKGYMFSVCVCVCVLDHEFFAFFLLRDVFEG